MTTHPRRAHRIGRASALAFGSIALTGALLAPLDLAFAAPGDDAAPPVGTEIVGVEIPARIATPTPSPTPTDGSSSTPPADGVAGGRLADTGRDATALWLAALAGAAVAASSTLLLTRRRRV